MAGSPRSGYRKDLINTKSQSPNLELSCLIRVSGTLGEPMSESTERDLYSETDLYVTQQSPIVGHFWLPVFVVWGDHLLALSHQKD